jgi:tetratricopeptide (TPR) repeat protein
VRRPDEGYPDTAYIESPGTPGLIHVEEAAGADIERVPPIALLEAYRAVLHDAPWLREKYLGLLNRLGAETPDEPQVLAARGHELLSTGADSEIEEAIPLLNKAFELRQSDPNICLDLADALSKQRRAEEADRVLERGLARDPYEPRLHKALIALRLKAEKYPASESAMRKYLQIFPADTGVKRLLTEIQNTSRR